MITLPNQSRIFLFGDPVNMQKSFEGLCALVQRAFPGELMAGLLYFPQSKTRSSKDPLLGWGWICHLVQALRTGLFSSSKQWVCKLESTRFTPAPGGGHAPKNPASFFSIKALYPLVFSGFYVIIFP